MISFYVLFLGISSLLILLLLTIRIHKAAVGGQQEIGTSDIPGIVIAIMWLGLALSQMGSHLGYIDIAKSRAYGVLFALSMLSLLYAYIKLSKGFTSREQ